jgi:long-chain fatty acid transport protein
MKRILLGLLATAAAMGVAGRSQAAGFYLQEQSARGTGRAYSGEVADLGPASLWWNPAAIAGSPTEVYLGAAAIFVDSKVSNTGSTITYPGGITLPVSGDAFGYQPIQAGLAPNLAASMRIADRYAIGLSVTAPYNFTTDYSPRAFARYDALHSRLTTADIQLTGAMQVTDWLDVGLGVDAQYTEAKLSTASPNLSPLLPDGITQLSGDGWDWGWTVGAQLHQGPLRIGASYRSAVDHDLGGRVFVGGLLGPLAAGNADTSGSASFSTPWIATLGARYQLNDRLTIDAQAQYFGWSEFNAINVHTAGGTQVLAQDYNNTISAAVGADYAVNERLTLRAGVQFDPTPTPDAERTARVPDGDRWLFAVGATGKVGANTQIDASFAYIDFANSQIHHDTPFYAGTPAQTITALRGDVEGEGYVLAVGVRTRF